MRVGAAFIFLMIALTASSAVAAAPKLVFRIDRATAMISHKHLVVTVIGAVRSGGWVNPTLRAHGSTLPEGRTLELEFVAKPPRPGSVVVQAILPVWTQIRTSLPRYGTVEVKIVSETNSVTVPITPQGAIQRSAAQLAAGSQQN